MAGVLPATLRVALRSKIAPGDFVNFRPLPPEYTNTLVRNQEVAEFQKLLHSHVVFIDRVRSRYITLDNICTVANVWQLSSRQMQAIHRGFAAYSVVCYDPIESLRRTGD